MSRHPRNFFLLAALLVAAPCVVSAQTPPADVFGEEQRVTAVDVVVGFENPDVPPPKNLDAEDFVLSLNGKPLTVVAVDAAERGDAGEPWSLVIYFDLVLSSPGQIAWAANLLSANAERLVELGQVELVVADPWPQRLLPPTRDAERLLAVLADLAFSPLGEDELVTLRDEVIEELGKEEPEIAPGELVHLVLVEEERIARRQQGELVRFLAEQTPVAGARRAVFWVSGGFDVEPQRFYARYLSVGDARADLQTDVEESGRLLAAYGWIVLPMARPDDGKVAGAFRVGKWLGQPAGRTIDNPTDPTQPERTTQTGVIGFSLKRKDNQDLKKAESHLDVGRALASSGELEEAVKELRRALYRFGEDPKSAKRQAVALVELAQVYRRLERPKDARRALKEAKLLDPTHPVAAKAPDGKLLAPLEPLTTLAEITTGGVLRNEDALALAFEDLRQRARVTYQVEAGELGRLHPLETRCLRRACTARAPQWTRFGTPDGIAERRVRRMLQGEGLDGDFELEARRIPGIGRRLALDLRFANDGDEVRTTADLRLTLGYGDPEHLAVVTHQRLEDVELRGESWSWEGDLETHGGRRWVAVVVEMLESGRWGAALVELPDSALPDTTDGEP